MMRPVKPANYKQLEVADQVAHHIAVLRWNEAHPEIVKAEAEAKLGLNEAQKREALALMDTSLPNTRAEIAAAINRHASDSPAVSPRGRLQTLHTPVYLLHGEADNIIPSAETLWMASELSSRDLKAILVSPLISHIDLEAKPGAMDEWRLVHFFALIMDAAETR